MLSNLLLNLKGKKTYLYIFIIPIILMFFNGIMIIFPKEIIKSAEKGLLLWFNKVIPSLLPFMICTNMLVGFGFPEILGEILGRFSKILKLRGVCMFPVIAGVISGYPMGVKVTVDLYKQGLITKNEAYRLFCFANNSGPLFILGTVGVGMLNSAKTGYLLIAVHYLSSFLIMCITLFFTKEKAEEINIDVIEKYKKYNFSFGKIMGESVNSALNTILMIGGYIILFSVVTAVVVKIGITLPFVKILSNLGMTQQQALGTIVGIIEITNGCSVLSVIKNKLSFVLCATIISWGGLSIHAQGISIISQTDLKSLPYLMGKMTHAVISFIISVLLVVFFI